MLKTIIALLVLSTSAIAAPKIVTIANEPRVQSTPDYDPEIIHAAGLVNQLKWGAVFQCGHVNPAPTGNGHVDVSTIKTPGRNDRYLIEVFIDFQC